MLTNEQCDEFRCHPDDFYSRVRAVYGLGRKHALEDAANKFVVAQGLFMSTQVYGEKNER